MKKVVLVLAAIAIATVVTGCGFLRTPKSGPCADKVYYRTFYGISIESAVYGDGILPGTELN